MSDETAALRGSAPSDAASALCPAYLEWQRKVRRDRARIRYIQFGLVVGFLLFREYAPRAGLFNPMLTSYPSAVWKGFWQLVAQGDLALHIWVTMIEVVVSFTASMVAGTAFAVWLWLSPTTEKVLDPFLVMLNALPKIALVPIFYIWLGPEGSIYAVAVAIALFITILMLFTGFAQTDPNKVKLARTLGASRLQVLTKVVLPGNVATFLATLKANVGLSLVGVIVGEFQALKAGLGYLIIYGSQIFRMDMVMASIVILGLTSLLIYMFIQLLERRLVH